MQVKNTPILSGRNSIKRLSQPYFHNGPLPLKVVAKIIYNSKTLNFTYFLIQHNLISLSHECERGCLVLVEYVICLFPLSVYFGKSCP